MSKFNLAMGNPIKFRGAYGRWHKPLSMGLIREIMYGMLPCYYLQVHTNMLSDPVLYPVLNEGFTHTLDSVIDIRAEGQGTRLSTVGFIDRYSVIPDNHIPTFRSWTASLGGYREFQVHGLNVVIVDNKTGIGDPLQPCVEFKAHGVQWDGQILQWIGR